jgi:A/G-specific adenine glycosylase
MPAAWRAAGEVGHGFTHFQLRIALYAARVERIAGEGFVHPLDALNAAALPSLMRKCVAAVGRQLAVRTSDFRGEGQA